MTIIRSISLRFIIILVVILILGQGIGTFFFIRDYKNYLIDSLNERIKRTGNLLAGVSVDPLLVHDYMRLDVFLEETIKDEDIISIRILDKNDRVVVKKIKETHPEAVTKRTPVSIEKELIGYAEITYTVMNINTSVKKNIITVMISQVAILLIISSAILFFYNANIKKPVLMINNTIEKITMGELSSDIPDLGDNEMGSIAKGIGFLLERLSKSVSRLGSTAVNVSMAIDQLTLTFKNVTQGNQKQTEAINSIIGSIKEAKESQDHITEDTGKLIDFSNENVTSLLEIKATADEVVASTSRLFKATEETYSVAAEISQTSKSIAANTEEAVAAVNDTSAAAEEISASVKEVESSAKKSAALASKVTEVVSGVGMMAIVEAVEGMEKITSEVKHASEIISRLGAKSADIEKILSVIKDVTEQTNLLSLNAAILAAQAGEYGKSFSVVADEIRALSDRTALSTKDISNIVKTIQTEISGAMKAIDSGTQKVNEGSAMVYKVGDALRETLSASEQSSNMSQIIEKATEEQVKGLKQIALSIDSIRKMISQIAKATHEQQIGTSHFVESVGDIKDAADIVNKGTEEEATTIKLITKNFELGDERVKQIGQSILHQQKANESIVAAMEQLRIVGSAILRDIEDVSLSLTTLQEEVDLLKKETDVFRLRNQGSRGEKG